VVFDVRCLVLCFYVCRRANEEVHVRGEFSVEEDIVEKQKQWISVALRMESDLETSTKHSGR